MIPLIHPVFFPRNSTHLLTVHMYSLKIYILAAKLWAEFFEEQKYVTKHCRLIHFLTCNHRTCRNIYFSLTYGTDSKPIVVTFHFVSAIPLNCNCNIWADVNSTLSHNDMGIAARPVFWNKNSHGNNFVSLPIITLVNKDSNARGVR